MSEDISYDVPTARVTQARFEVVSNHGRRSDRWLAADETKAAMWRDKLIAIGRTADEIEIHELSPMGRAA